MIEVIKKFLLFKQLCEAVTWFWGKITNQNKKGSGKVNDNKENTTKPPISVGGDNHAPIGVGPIVAKVQGNHSIIIQGDHNKVSEEKPNGSLVQQYREQQRFEGARNLKVLLKKTVNYIVEVADRADLYQWDHTNADLTILPKQFSKPEPSRPSNYIRKKIEAMEEESCMLLEQIGGQESVKVGEKIEELKKYCVGLQGAIYTRLDEKRSHFLNVPCIQNMLNNYPDDLYQLLREVKAILDPAIK